MSKSQFVDFKAVKAAVTMEQVLQHYGLLEQMKRSGDSLSGPCPIHNGTNPTQFRVSVSKNCWNCFSDCKCGGNVLDFVAKKEDITVHAAALKLREWFNLPTTDKPPEEEGEPPRAAAPTQRTPAPTPTASKEKSQPDDGTPNVPLKFRLEQLDGKHPYLTERGLTPETIVDFGLGHCAKGMMTGRIAIPIHNAEGKVVAYAGRWPGEPAEGTPKYKLPPGFRKSQELFNLDRAGKQPGPLVIVEGFFGAMKLWQCGVKRVVALMGSTLSTAQAELIRKHTDSRSQVIVMLDEDEAGRAGREDIVSRLAPWLFVKAHVFEQAGQQPEHLTPEELHNICGGVP
ncbi:MAG: CHC2 zinc finger domain-containing protein [Limisphaerales bacterium]